MTEGRCFLPGFEGDCKDGGSETKEWVKRFFIILILFTKETAITPDLIQARLWQQLRKLWLSFPAQPQTLNVEFTPHKVRATLHFLRTKKRKRKKLGTRRHRRSLALL